MRKSTRQQTSPPGARGGFTLVELMIVIVIIAILLGLLIPAVTAVRNRARVAQVKTEISELTQAITEFKVTYGVEPPSTITLQEVGGSWDPRSRAFFRRMWPQCNFNIDRDFNGDGNADTAITLTGAECLVFFLGGMRDPNSGAYVGFSKNPANPFATGGNREGPFYEFEPQRLVDVNDNDFPEFVDIYPNQQTPYLYVSSYDGKGYPDPNVSSSAVDMVVFNDSRDMTSVYRMGTASNAPAYKPKGFQIISPGVDGQYGTGGGFDPSGNDRFPLPDPMDPDRSLTEADNITNFHDGLLGG